MSRIRKLSIKGIRNFDDGKDTRPIEFSRPLTLILGPNGTGKTTIIECLKYALCGEFPPNSEHGKSFIHDPMLKKLAAICVRGNVKAEVSDCRGDRLTITRTIEAQRINKQVKFRTLDSTIIRTDRKTGKKSTLGAGCATVDVEVMLSMGVSKAILNYVLFCHQDDANWPFETGKKLKERFDEIFDTSRYNKALDCIRKLIKEKQSSLKGLTTEQRALQIIVDEVRSKKKKLKEFEARCNEAREKIQDLTTKLVPINHRLAELKEIETDHGKWQIEYEKKKMECKLARQQVSSLREEIKEVYEGTIAELTTEIVSYQQILAEKNEEIAQHEHHLAENAVKEAKMGKQIAERRVAVGTAQQHLSDQAAKISQRNDTLREINTAWELNESIASDISETDAVVLIEKCEQVLRKLEDEIENKRLEQDREMDKHQQKLNALRSEKSITESQLAHARKELQGVKEDVRATLALLKQSGAMQQKLNDVGARLAEANEKVEEFKRTSEIDSLKRKIQEAEVEEESYERKCNLIEKEVTLLREQSSLRMKLESSQAELIAKEKEIETLKEKHRHTLETLLGKKECPEGNMMGTINEIQGVLNDRVRNLRKEIDTVQYEAMKLETSLKHKKEELAKKKKEVQNDKAKVSLHCGEFANYREVLLLNSKKVKDIEDKRGMYAYQGAAYKEYIKKLTEPESCCPLCHRGFENKKDAMELVTEMRSDMTGHPERLKTCEKELTSQRKKYDALLQLQSIVDKIEHLQDIEIPKISEDMEDDSKSLALARQKIKRLEESILEPERKMSVCKDMIGDMALWDRYSNEIENINFTVMELQDRLRDAGLTSDKTIEEAQNEQSNLQKSMKDARRNIKSLQLTLDSRNDQLRAATECRTKLLETQLRINKEMQDIKQAQEALEGLRTKETSVADRVESLEERRCEIVKQCENANDRLEIVKKEIRSIQDRDRNTIRERGNDFDRVNSIQREVKHYLARKIENQLKTVQQQLDCSERYAEKFKNERILRESELVKMKKEAISEETRKRDLTDNLTMRRKEVEADALELDCQLLRDKLSGVDYASVSKERKNLCERRDVTERERNIAQGNSEELERNVTQLKRELEKNEYRLAKSNYKEKCVELAVCRQCAHDLLLYSKVLDSAMIEYHEERMNTVNKIMKKLWELIYTGVDTTSIQIRTEATTTSGVDKRRQFNYKLVQVKHGIEMDMRGRCSAGQKVLASIILRLALAETFCEKCGVLALDEPTTNLDEENAKSLADALHNYVHQRARFQKNFQLIVITHDENFIPKLGQLSSNNSYYELFRYDSGLSGIRNVSLDGPSEIPRDAYNNSSDEEFAASSKSKTSKRKKYVFD